ncbi:MAG: hypothetical protein IKL32_01265 [Alphaproteobacteria bacterium]|nr:hypothetical protein [Alphaproteobacteria bacterium]
MNTPDNQNNAVGFVNPQNDEHQRLESEIQAGFDYIHQKHRPDFNWKNVLMLGSMIALIGAAETFRETDKKWYSFPVSLAAVAAMGYAAKISDKKDLLKVENDVLHKVLDFPLYKKESAYRAKFMQAVQKTPNPIKTMADFDNFSDNEKFWKRDGMIYGTAILGVNAAMTALFYSIPITLFCIGATISAAQGIIYRKHSQNRKILRATLPAEVQIPQMKINQK